MHDTVKHEATVLATLLWSDCLMDDDRAFVEGVELKTGWFTHAFLRRVSETVLHLRRKKIPVYMETVKDAMIESGAIATPSDQAFFVHLTARTPVPKSIFSHSVHIIKEHSLKRITMEHGI